MKTFDRAAFLSAATTLLEDVVPGGALGLEHVPIRELTAAQRLEAVEVAKAYDAEGEEITLPDGSTRLDMAKYWAAIVQMSVLDPATCYDGDTFLEGKGRTLLTPDDIFTLAEQGKEGVQDLAQYILRLSWMTRDAMFRHRPQVDDSQSTQGDGDSAPNGGTPPEGVDVSHDGTVLGVGRHRVGHAPDDAE